MNPEKKEKHEEQKKGGKGYITPGKILQNV
jgi:hypothetical protein